MKKCPFCAEKIQDEALKCKHCGSNLDNPHNESVAKKYRSKYGKASAHSDYNTTTILSILLPVVGIIVGIIYLTKSQPLDKKLGEHAIAFSILFMIVWYFVFSMLGINFLII